MSRGRTRVIGPLPTRSTSHRRLEAGLGPPITGRRQFVMARSVALLVAAVVAALFLDHERAGALVLLLIATACIQPLIPLIPPRRSVSEYQAVADLVVLTTVMWMLPELWPMTMLWIGTIVAWHALASPLRLSFAISVASVAAIAVIGSMRDVEWWYFALITEALLASAFTIYGHTLRREIWDTDSALMDAISAAGAIVHHSDLELGTVVRIAGDLNSFTGWSAEEWCNIDHREFIHPDDLDGYWVDVDEVAPNTIVDRLARVRRKDGSWAWIRDLARISEDSRGHRTMRGFTLDVTDIEEARETIARQLRHDNLTGLPNRLALSERLTELLASSREFALMITDLDRFKEVNDTLGHEAGDQLLQTIARRLTEVVGPDDLVARLGGDEYAIVVLRDDVESEVVALAQRLSIACAQPVSLAGVDIAVASSTGIALRSRSGADRATLLRHADIAMYEAKRASESFRVFDASLERTSTVRLSLSASLADAIKDGQITMHFQPKYDLATRRLVGAEALARWDHPELGLLTPAAFLDIALMSETAAPFALATIEQVATMIRRMSDVGRPMPIAANIAMRALRDGDFAEVLLAVLDRFEVAPHLLVLELTESDALWPNPHVMAGLRALGDAGVHLSIDDFGTGHSSLERLRKIRVHELKIDRSFVDGMSDDPLQRHLAGTVIELAFGLGYRVVAEGVEREDQVAMLLEMGCTTAQGYLFARPMPADEFAAHADRVASADTLSSLAAT